MSDYTIAIGDDSFNKDEVIEFLARIYGPNYFDARVFQGFTIENEPSTRPENFIFARSAQGKLVGMVRIVERVLSLGSSQLKVGAISSVAVLPDWRGKGVMSKLMNVSFDLMQSRGIELSILHGRRAVDGLYSRFGYYGIGRYLNLEVLSCPNFFSNPAPTLTVAPFRKENLDMMMQLYQNVYHPLAGSSVRDAHIWNFLINKVKLLKGTEILEFREEHVDDFCGYFIRMGDTLVEAVLPPRAFPAIPELLKVQGIKSAALHPRHPLFCFLRTHCNTSLKERFALDGGYMARIINFEGLIKKISKGLTLRAHQIGVSGECVRLFGHTINLLDGAIKKTAAPNDIQFENEEAAVLLILGAIRPEDIPGIHLDISKPWLSYLFSETDFHTSAWDEV